MNKTDKPFKPIRYTDEQMADFCELAKYEGINRARRQLGFPKSYGCAARWLRARDIQPAFNDILDEIRRFRKLYAVEDLLDVVDAAISVVDELLLSASTPDDAKRLADSLRSLVQTRQLLEGKATTVTERREVTQQDLEIADLLRVEQVKQTNGKSNSPLEV